MVKFGVLTQWFDPEPGPAALPGVLARGLVDLGHEVQVVTGFPNYPSGRLYPGYRIRPHRDENIRGVAVRRTALIPSHNANAVARAANYASFGVTSAALGVTALRECDAVWVSNSPVTVVPAMKRLDGWGVPLLLHVLDLWPDNVRASGFAERSRSARAAERMLGSLASATYGLAEAVATISPSAIQLLAARGVPTEKLTYIPLWADEDTFKPVDGRDLREALGVPSGTVVVLYAGALGWNQGIEYLLEALALYPVTAPALECWIAGSGVAEAKLRTIASSLGSDAPVVRFLGRLAPETMNEYMGAADVHYVGLRPDASSAQTMPSKVQATLAVAKPLVAAVGGDVASLTAGQGFGWSTQPGDPTGICAALTEAALTGRDGLLNMGQLARMTYEKDFSIRRGVGRIEDALIRIARVHP